MYKTTGLLFILASVFPYAHALQPNDTEYYCPTQVTCEDNNLHDCVFDNTVPNLIPGLYVINASGPVVAGTYNFNFALDYPLYQPTISNHSVSCTYVDSSQTIAIYLSVDANPAITFRPAPDSSFQLIEPEGGEQYGYFCTGNCGVNRYTN